MAEKKDRERVMAEITISYVLRLAKRTGLLSQPGTSPRISQRRGARLRDVEAHDAGWRKIHRLQLVAECARTAVWY